LISAEIGLKIDDCRGNAKGTHNMKKASPKKTNDDLRPEYDFLKLEGGARGKYYRQAVKPTRRTESLNQLNFRLDALQRERLKTLGA